jgi:hypothetical protein
MAEEEKQPKVAIEPEAHKKLSHAAFDLGTSKKHLVSVLVNAFIGLDEPNNKGILTVGSFMDLKYALKYLKPGLRAPEWALEAQLKWMEAVTPYDLAAAQPDPKKLEAFLKKVQEACEIARRGVRR